MPPATVSPEGVRPHCRYSVLTDWQSQTLHQPVLWQSPYLRAASQACPGMARPRAASPLDNGIDIGTLQDGTYFVYHANPGQHILAATTDTTSTQNLKFQAGATYYIKAGVLFSQHLFQPSLSVVFDLQGQAAVQNLRGLHYHE